MTSDLPARPQEQLLCEHLKELPGPRVLCTSAGLAQLARSLGERCREARIDCVYLDLFRAQLAQQAKEPELTNVNITCQADFPDESYDLIALPLSSQGEAELAREFLQEGLLRLREGGTLAASTDSPRDSWLGEQFERLGLAPRRTASPLGTLYVATKTGPLKKRKEFACQLAFRDRGRLIQAYSRPGVFSHRHIDPGARQVLAALELTGGELVLDIGCGAGVLALAAACRANGVSARALDSNARAVECVQRGAALNELESVTSELTTLDAFTGAGTYQVALANPPYYARFEIARRFLAAGRAALAPGGVILVVTKMPDWYAEHMAHWFTDVTLTESKGYWIARGRVTGD